MELCQGRRTEATTARRPYQRPDFSEMVWALDRLYEQPEDGEEEVKLGPKPDRELARADAQQGNCAPTRQLPLDWCRAQALD